MINDVSNALNAYQTALSRIGGKAPVQEQAPVAATGFGQMVQESISNAADLGKKSEVMSIQGIQGKADIQDVVLAVSNAQMALETVVAVRDTAIKAYQSIISMQI